MQHVHMHMQQPIPPQLKRSRQNGLVPPMMAPQMQQMEGAGFSEGPVEVLADAASLFLALEKARGTGLSAPQQSSQTKQPPAAPGDTANAATSSSAASSSSNSGKAAAAGSLGGATVSIKEEGAGAAATEQA